MDIRFSTETFTGKIYYYHYKNVIISHQTIMIAMGAGVSPHPKFKSGGSGPLHYLPRLYNSRHVEDVCSPNWFCCDKLVA